MKTIITMLVLTVLGSAISAQNIKLPAPKKSGGKALMDCLNERQTDRNFDTKQLSLQDLSDLVWAANGINRPESGKRTVPTATNWQEMVLYVATADGIYRYNAEKHELELVKKGDFRKECGPQPFMGIAPVCFIYTADHNKKGRITNPEHGTIRLSGMRRERHGNRGHRFRGQGRISQNHRTPGKTPRYLHATRGIQKEII